MKLGVSLTEQGYDPPSAALLDWLVAIDETVAERNSDDDS